MLGFPGLGYFTCCKQVVSKLCSGRVPTAWWPTAPCLKKTPRNWLAPPSFTCLSTRKSQMGTSCVSITFVPVAGRCGGRKQQGEAGFWLWTSCFYGSVGDWHPSPCSTIKGEPCTGNSLEQGSPTRCPWAPWWPPGCLRAPAYWPVDEMLLTSSVSQRCRRWNAAYFLVVFRRWHLLKLPIGGISADAHLPPQSSVARRLVPAGWKRLGTTALEFPSSSPVRQ